MKQNVMRLGLILVAVGIVLAVMGVPYSGVVVLLGALAFVVALIAGAI